MKVDQKTIIVVGSVNADTLVYLDKLPSRHETVLGNASIWAVGGKGGNQAVAAARASGNVKLLASVGADSNGAACLGHLNKNNVDTTLVHIAEGNNTGQAIVLVDSRGDNMIAVAPGANAALSSKLMQAYFEAVPSTATVLFQLEIPIEAVREGLVQSKKIGATTILNPAPYHDDAETLLPYCDVITPNQAEAAALTEVSVSDRGSAEKASEILIEMGARASVITLGKNGCFVREGETAVHIPAFRTENVVDTTGAGDVFNGAFAVGLAEGKNLVDAARLATAASGLSVQVKTASQSAPRRSEIDVLLKA